MVHDESFGIIPLSYENEVWKVFLILHKKGNHWSYPKGHKHEGETPLQSATRELHEETGLSVVRFLQETPLLEEYRFRREGELVLKKVYFFPAIVSGELRLQPQEIREGKWLTLKDALHQLSFKEGRSICSQLMKILDVV